MTRVTIRTTQVCLEYVRSFGGSAKAVRDFASALESVIVAFSPLHERSEEWSDNVIHVPTLRSWLGRLYSVPDGSSGLDEARQALIGSRAVFLHLLFRRHVTWAGAICRKAKIPYFVVPHGALDPYVFTYRSLPKQLWMVWVGRRLMKNAKAVIFISEREREKAAPFLDGCHTLVVRLPIEHIDLSRRMAFRSEVRQDLEIEDSARVLVWMGRLDRMKRIEETINILERVRDSSIHLLVVGPDGHLTAADIERHCQRKGIRNVHVIGPVYGDRRYRYFMAADAYISLSHRENFNYTAAEALACGLPVILSPGNDLAFDLISASCGWLLNTISADEAVQAIQAFAATPQSLLLAKGAAARQWAREELSLDTFSRSITELVANCK